MRTPLSRNHLFNSKLNTALNFKRMDEIRDNRMLVLYNNYIGPIQQLTCILIKKAGHSIASYMFLLFANCLLFSLFDLKFNILNLFNFFLGR